MAGGRPTKLNDVMKEKAIGYVKNFETFGDSVPSIASMALELGVNRSTLYEWAEKDDQFSDILQICNSTQERVCINRALKGDYNANIAKLLLGKHGYHERTENSHNVTMLSHEDWLDSLDE
ncbi:MAG: terminase small subunit [Thiotrichaceae bacterium]